MGDGFYGRRKVPAFTDLVQRMTEMQEEQKVDSVNQPAHYNNGKVECIDGIEASMSPDEFKGYLKGNLLKYVWRYQYKGKPIEDLRKARWYLEKLIEVNL